MGGLLRGESSKVYRVVGPSVCQATLRRFGENSIATEQIEVGQKRKDIE